MTITDAEIEAVARRFCIEMGLEPEAPVTTLVAAIIRLNISPSDPIIHTRPTWEAFSQQARRAIAMHRALFPLQVCPSPYAEPPTAEEQAVIDHGMCG